jgi:hypothetical protein
MIGNAIIESAGTFLWSISDVLLGATIALLGSWLFYRQSQRSVIKRALRMRQLRVFDPKRAALLR